MKLQPVKSSNVHSVGYDANSKTMAVKFHSGETYHYHDVAPEQHSALVNAKSIGAHHAQYCRGFRCSKQ